MVQPEQLKATVIHSQKKLITTEPEGLMKTKKFAVAAVLTYALISLLGTARQIQAQSDQTAYSKMAPLEQYLMDRDAEIALARTAAPEDISRDATILVLGRHGYETAVKGKNGFVCLVERAWMGPLEGINFNTKNRAPLCLNPQAVRFILPIDYKRTEQALAGRSKEQIIEWTKAAYEKKELPDFEPGAMAYMMSKAACLTANCGNLAHVMFYTPVINGATWGADVPHSPILSFSQGPPEPFNVYLFPTGRWSDGTPAELP
jgi:hypothetical protein